MIKLNKQCNNLLIRIKQTFLATSWSRRRQRPCVWDRFLLSRYSGNQQSHPPAGIS